MTETHPYKLACLRHVESDSACLDVESGGVSFTGDAEQGGETQSYDALRNATEENLEDSKTDENY